MESGRSRVRGGLAFIYSLGSRFLRDERGQATTEYILLLSFIGVFSGVFGRRMLKTITDSILKFNTELEKDLKTGRTPLRAWRN